MLELADQKQPIGGTDGPVESVVARHIRVGDLKGPQPQAGGSAHSEISLCPPNGVGEAAEPGVDRERLGVAIDGVVHRQSVIGPGGEIISAAEPAQLRAAAEGGKLRFKPHRGEAEGFHPIQLLNRELIADRRRREIHAIAVVGLHHQGGGTQVGRADLQRQGEGEEVIVRVGGPTGHHPTQGVGGQVGAVGVVHPERW